jgi:hypothetical protein
VPDFVRDLWRRDACSHSAGAGGAAAGSIERRDARLKLALLPQNLLLLAGLIFYVIGMIN